MKKRLKSVILGSAMLALMGPTTAEAVKMAGGASWGTPGNSGKPFKLGSASKETCFLTGVEGSLKGGSTSLDKTTASVSVYINKDDNTWYIKTRAGHGSGVLAKVRCVLHVANRTFLNWDAGGGLFQLYSTAPLSPNRYCFLTSVSATTGFTGMYNGQRTQVNVRETGSDWRLSGYLEPRQDGKSGGRATAVCVDIENVKWSGTGTWYGPNIGSSETLMGANSGGMGCFLTGISGNYYLSPPAFGWEDGVRIFQNAWNSQENWFVRSRSGKGAYVLCVQ